MAEKHHLKIEVLAPTNIESEAPRQQILRVAEDVPEGPPTDNGAEIDNGEIKWNTLKGLLQPMYVGEPERPPARYRRPQPEETEVPEDKNSSDEKKTKTRIPVSRFKTAVAKVQRERNDSEESNEPKRKEAPEKPPRRSSIPKLSDRILAARKNAYNAHNNEQADKNGKEPAKSNANHQPVVKPAEKKPIKMDRIPVRRHFNRETENHDRNIATVKIELDETQPVTEFDEAAAIKDTLDQLDDEFDKLYDEIVDTEVESLPEEILNAKVKDPEKLDSKFEEIVHQYDEETIEEVRVEPIDKARYSKIPLLKRRSEQEIKVPKQSERRLSLKTGLHKLAKTNAEQQANDETIKSSTPGDDGRDLNQEFEVEAEKSVVLDDNAQIEVENTDDNNLIERQSPMPTPAYNIIATPDAELVKVGLSNFDLERNAVTQDNVSNDIATPEPETVKVSVLDISNETYAAPIETDPETIDIRVGYLVEEPVSIDAPQNIESVIIIDNPETIEVSEVNLIENDNEVNDKIYEENKKEEPDSNDTVKVATIDFNKPVENHPFIPDTVSEFKSVNLLRGTSAIEERTKSRYVNKPVKNESENISKSYEEEIPIVKGKVIKILKRLTSQDDNDLNSNNNVEFKNDDVPLKGNVSKIINRMTSQDIDRNVKKEFDEIPKKKSVLSRIAMFERPAQEASLPKKQPYKYSKPKRTISEEIRHSPKIVQEVLKPHMRNGNTEKPYELVSIDIMQPTEVIVNNEEQALVVEELKEETVVYENLDHFELRKPIDEPKEATILDDNIPIEDNFNKNERVEFKPEEFEIFTNETFEPQNGAVEETNFEIIGDRPNVIDSYRSREAVKEYIPVKEKIKRLKSRDDSNLRRAKSTAELDIGEAVKGKVKNIIVRMNSMDFLDDRDDILEEKEKISAKERPRKRSVSEKIAMFERKLTPVKMEDVSVNAARALNIDPKPRDPTNTANSVNSPTKPHQPTEPAPTPEPTTLDQEQDYNDKIRELMSAKMTHGSVTTMPTVQLRDGKKMPVIALGTALLDPRLSKHIVASAIDLGFRAIDTAFIYGTEKEVGEGIRAKLQDGTVQREELFIMSKLWSTFHKPELVESACRASLAALGIEYFDLFMIHNPMSFKEGNDPLPKIANVLQFSSYDYLDAWFAMEELVGKGLVRSIGVSNFNSEQVARVVEKGRMKPVVDQVECHPYLSQQRLSDFCDARDVRLSCFGTLGSKGTPAELKASQAAAIDDPLVQVMAAGLGISPAQLLIRYQIECGHNVVVKASSAAHQWDVLRALNVTLAPAQVAALHALNRNKRAFTFKGMGDTHRNYPFKIPF